MVTGYVSISLDITFSVDDVMTISDKLSVIRFKEIVATKKPVIITGLNVESDNFIFNDSTVIFNPCNSLSPLGESDTLISFAIAGITLFISVVGSDVVLRSIQ